MADGPRFPDEEDVCLRVRAIATSADWPCEIETRFACGNMGCCKRISSGISWVFSRVAEAIILEDDCYPHADFYRFCAAMLRAHRSDTRVMMVTGTNIAGRWRDDRQDFHFSLYGSIWGWAAWRRAWNHYDLEARLWADPRAREAIRHLFPADEAEARETVFNAMAERKIDTWDYHWTLARLLQSGLCVVPSRNLVRNIGFGKGATHTATNSRRADAELHPHPGPYRPAIAVVADRAYDRFVYENNGCGFGRHGNWLRRSSEMVSRRLLLEASRFRHLISDDWKKL
ncbi:MAG: glycosyltransferase family 2 protein [Opitutaceae bacterium]